MSNIKLFEDTNIRGKWNEDEDCWYFVIQDVIQFLTETDKPHQYWYDMKRRGIENEGVELSAICRQLKFMASNGKTYKYDCASNEGIFRIIQSIPSPKAEPFKRWLAKLGKERIEEIEQPDKAIDRARGYYTSKGRDGDWIDKRLVSIATRNHLTDYWQSNGIKNAEYSILTNQIYSTTFGHTAIQYKTIKGLKKSDSLRNHMNPIELILTMFAEQSSKEIAESQKAQGFDQNKKAIDDAGKIISKARKELEEKTGKPIVSKDNFKHQETDEITRNIAQRESKLLPGEFDKNLKGLINTPPPKDTKKKRKQK